MVKLKSEAYLRRYADGLYHSLWQELGQMLIFSRVLKQVLKWHHSRPCMVKGVKLLWVHCKREKRRIIGPDLVVEAEEKVKVIHENFQDTQSRQNSYLRRKESPCNSKLIIMSTFGFTNQGYTHFPHLIYLPGSRDEILFKG